METRDLEPVGERVDEPVDVTVVVPTYNTERFLDEALTSLEQNSRINLEILAINDGSRDGSLEIMRAHECLDPRVRVIDKKNEGYGASVNRGFAEARGTYVAILEPDDWVEPHMYDDLFEYAMSFGLKTPPDVVKSPYWRIWMPTTPQERRLKCPYYHRIHPAHQPFKVEDCPRVVQHHPSIWSALYRRAFLSEKNIRMMEVPGAGWVDNPFWYETMCQADTIVYLDKPYYCYREDLPGSSSANRVLALSFERWNNMCDVCDRLQISDQGVRRALAVVAFRYVGEAIAQVGFENAELTEQMKRMFARIAPETILSLNNVSPQLRALAFKLTGRPQPKISSFEYFCGLVGEFAYSIQNNGPGFAVAQTKLYLERRKNQDKRSEHYEPTDA